MDSNSGAGNTGDRYSDRNTSSGSSWGAPSNGPTSAISKSFGNLQSVANNDPWGSLKQQPPPESNSWANQDRYDRTYNERKTSYLDSNIGNTVGNRANSGAFLGSQRGQERYSNNISSRFDNGRF